MRKKKKYEGGYTMARAQDKDKNLGRRRRRSGSEKKQAAYAPGEALHQRWGGAPSRSLGPLTGKADAHEGIRCPPAQGACDYFALGPTPPIPGRDDREKPSEQHPGTGGGKEAPEGPLRAL